jgi:cytochrome P450
MDTQMYRLGECIGNPYLLYTSSPGPLSFDPVIKIWVCTGYPEAEVILRNQDAFGAARLRDSSLLRARGLHSLAPIYDILRSQLLFLDGASHKWLRAALQKPFTAPAVTAEQTFMQTLVEESLNQLPDRGEIDLVSDYAAFLPTTLSAHLLGLPPEDLPHFIEWNEAYEEVLASFSGYLNEHIVPVLEEEMAYFRAHIQARHRHPGDDLISEMILAFLQRNDTNEEMMQNAIAANCVMLLAGGYQTATNLIVQGLRSLGREPRYRHFLITDPKAILSETMRLEGSSQYVARQVLRDIDLADQSIRKGQTILVLLAAANRDERVFPAPTTFRPERWAKPSKPHLGFSLGRHFCIGAPYAEALAQSAMRSFIDRFPDYEVMENRLVWGTHTNVRCPRHVPVRLHSSQEFI